MSKIFQKPFEPKSYKDFAFNNPASKLTMDGILNGAVPFPGNKCSICLHGAYGTGKTALAKMLPTLLENSGHLPIFPRHASVFEVFDWVHYNACNIIGGDKTFVKDLLSRVNSPMLGSPNGWHYEILDEVDNLSDQVQASLKGLMDPIYGTIYILTTNNPDKLDGGVVNRSHMIEMNYPSPPQYQALGTSWLIERGFTGNEISSAQWATIMADCKGFREFGDSVEIVVRNLRRQQPAVV